MQPALFGDSIHYNIAYGVASPVKLPPNTGAPIYEDSTEPDKPPQQGAWSRISRDHARAGHSLWGLVETGAHLRMRAWRACHSGRARAVAQACARQFD